MKRYGLTTFALCALMLASTSSLASANLPGERKSHATMHGVYQDPLQGDMHFKNKYGHEGKIEDRVTPITRVIREIHLQMDKDDGMLANNSMLRMYIEKILSMPKEDYKRLEHYMLMIQKIPGVKAEYEMRPAGGNKDDLIIRVARERGKVILETNNHGDKDLGKQQYSFFGQLLNPFGFNDSIILNVGTSEKPDDLLIGTVGYMKRLNAIGTSIKLLASYLRDNPFAFDQKDNNTKIYKGQLEHYLLLANDNSAKVSVGMDYRDVEEQNSTTRTINSKYDYYTGFIGATFKHKDMFSAENWLYLDLITTLSDATIDRITPTATTFDRNFTLFKLNWVRDHGLMEAAGGSVNLFTQVNWMISHNDLPIEQQFSVGNNTIGKGYRNGLISASQGIAPNVELRYTRGYENHPVIEIVQPYIFVEGAHVTQTRSTISKKDLYSWGGGLRLFAPFDMRADIDVAQPFTKNVVVGGLNRKNETNVTFMISKEFKF